MKKLISMTDFVLKQNKQLKNAPDAYEQYCKIVNHANFFKQTPTLGDFVACDEEGNVLEEPRLYYSDKDLQRFKGIELSIVLGVNERVKKYQQAQSKVIFKGFSLSLKNSVSNGKVKIVFYKKENGIFLENLHTNQCFEIKTIEDLVPYNLEMV